MIRQRAATRGAAQKVSSSQPAKLRATLCAQLCSPKPKDPSGARGFDSLNGSAT